MVARRIATFIAAIVLALALSSCSELRGEATSDQQAAMEAFGTPRLPSVQGLLELSTTRSLEILSNFEYREHKSAGQWASAPAMFEVYDNNTPATISSALPQGEPGWILQLRSSDGKAWQPLTKEALEAGTKPGMASFVVFTSKGLSFEDLDQVIKFVGALFSNGVSGVLALDTSTSPGCIISCVEKNFTGAVCHVVEQSPGEYRLDFFPSSRWDGGSYDELVEACKHMADEASCEYLEFKL